MKIKQIIVGVIASILTIGSVGTLNVQTVSAGQDDFIMPYYNGYVETSEAKILSQNTVIDMSAYNGVGGVGVDAGIVTAKTEYRLSVVRQNAIFYLPYSGMLQDLDEINITVNNVSITPERLYGDMPHYSAGVGTWDTVVDAISSVKPLAIQDGTGKVYTFSTSEESLEFSFKKTAEQTIFHQGYNWSSQGIDGYSYRYDSNTNEAYPYKVFVSNGELIDIISNVAYTIEDVSYQDYVDYYVNEIIADMGEEYRPVIYSQFNRSLNGQVKDVMEVLFDVSLYTFALLKIPMQMDTVSIVVNSNVKPMVNGLYKPYIYTVRTVSAYPQECAYSLEIKMPSLIPYVVEENIGLSKLKCERKTQIADGYYIVSAEKKPDYVLDNNEVSDKNWLWLWILLVVIASVGVGFLVWWIWGFVERRRSE